MFRNRAFRATLAGVIAAGTLAAATPAQAIAHEKQPSSGNTQRCQGLSIEETDIFTQGHDGLPDRSGKVREGDQLRMTGYIRNGGFRSQADAQGTQTGYFLDGPRDESGSNTAKTITWQGDKRPDSLQPGERTFFTVKDVVTEDDARRGEIVRTFEFPIATRSGGAEVCTAAVEFASHGTKNSPTPLSPGGIVGIVTGALSALGAIGSLLWLAFKAIFR